jgi:hypothetical protein
MLEYWANPYNFKFFDRIKWIDVLEFNPPNPVNPVETLLLRLFLTLWTRVSCTCDFHYNLLHGTRSLNLAAG